MNNLLQLTEFYEVAFSDYIKIKWANTGFEKMGEEVKNLAFYTFLTAFYNNTEMAIANRRRSLFYYLQKSGYATDKSENIINRMRDILPVDSFIKRLLNDTCVIYDDAPARTFSQKESVHDKMQMLYDTLKVDVKMPSIYELTKLCTVVAVSMVVRNNKPKFVYMTPDKFRVVTDEIDYTDVRELHYVDYSTSVDAYVHHKWTNDVHTMFVKGKLIEEEENIYGIIPFAFSRITDTDGFFGGGLYEQAFKNLQTNNHNFNADREAVINGMTQWIAVNMPSSIANRSPDVIHRVEQRSDVEVPPDMRPITSDGLYTDIQEFSQNLKNQTMLDFGEPADYIDTTIGAEMSGISRYILHSKLNEIRRADIPKMQSFESDLSEIIRIIANVDYFKEPINELDFSITYTPITIVNDPAVDYENDKIKLRDGMMSLKEFTAKHGSGFDADMTEEDIVSIIETRKSLFKTSTPDANTDDSANNVDK